MMTLQFSYLSICLETAASASAGWESKAWVASAEVSTAGGDGGGEAEGAGTDGEAAEASASEEGGETTDVESDVSGWLSNGGVAAGAFAAAMQEAGASA